MLLFLLVIYRWTNRWCRDGAWRWVEGWELDGCRDELCVL